MKFNSLIIKFKILIKMYEYFENGISKGYYDLETFCQSLYKILIKNYGKISEKLFIELVNKLCVIDKCPSKISNTRAVIDNISYLCVKS